MAGKWKEVVRLHFEGERFRDHALDLSALGTLRQFQKIVAETAKELWKAANPDRERMPKNFEDRTRLCLRTIEEGSATVPLEVFLEEEPQADLWLEEPVELKEALDLAMGVFDAAHADRPLPERFPKRLLSDYAEWGSSLGEGESLELTREGLAPVKVSPAACERLAACADAPYEDAVEVSGQVLEADVRRRTFQLWLDEKQGIKVTFSSAQEKDVTSALKEYQSIRLSLKGRGQFSSQGKLQTINRVDEVMLVAPGPPAYDPTAPRIEDVIAAIAAQIPDAEWEKLPKDMSSNLDHYIYGVADE